MTARSGTIEITVQSDRWQPEARWEALVGRAVDACAVDAGRTWPGRPVDVLLCDDEMIRDLNRRWRGFDKATNVLSFPAVGPVHPQAPLGDVALAFETVEREAEAEGKTLDDHAAHLIVHGVLHLLGENHETGSGADAMETRERRILAALGIADPYADAPLVGHPP